MPGSGSPEEAAQGSEAPPKLLVGRRRAMLAALVLNGFLQAAAAVAAALLAGRAFDRLAADPAAVSPGALAGPGGGLVAVAVILGVLRARERADAERLSQDYVHAIRGALYRRLSRLSPRSLQRRSQGAVMLRFVGDLGAVNRWVSLGLARLVVSSIFVLGALGALAALSPLVAGAVAAVALGGLGAALISARTLRDDSREARRRRARLAANVTEKAGAMGVVQAFGQTRRERRRVERQSRELGAAMVARATTIGRMRGVTEATTVLTAVAVMLAGAAEVSGGRAGVGTVVAALTVAGLLASPLRDLGRVNELWNDSRVAMEKIESFLQAPAEVRSRPGAPALEPGPGRLELRDVWVSGALEGVSAAAEPGSVVAIEGPNGAGKSTLLAVAARLVVPARGAVMLDGQDLRGRSEASIRRAISVVGPDFPLLRGSVARNLRYRRPRATEQELARVRELCALDALLAELPDGERTRVAEGGRNLSAGQRQRVALARALLGDAAVLLLDEADANLDESARGALERVIRAERGRRTILVVSHRPQVAELADATWRLDSGRLVTGAGGASGAGGDPAAARTPC